VTKNPASRADLVLRDKRYVWHPYTPMEAYVREGLPLVIERARGVRLEDADGRTFLDGNSSWWTSLLGHNHPRLVAALQRQAEELCHVALAGITHRPAVELAEALCQRAPAGLSHVFYSDNGSTAVEAAIKLAIQYFHQNGAPDKAQCLALEHAFHGETLGVTALGDVAAFSAPFRHFGSFVQHVPSPADGLDRALGSLEQVLRQKGDRIAALVLEPLVQGAGGMRFYDPSYLKAARELTARHDVLLVLDEVFTGFGRTGTFWAADAAGISPDILCLAKGLSGGILPFAATLTTERVFDGFLGDPARAFHYGHTYCGNPLGARVALEVLEVYREECVIERAAPKAERLAAAFRRFAEKPGVTRVRSRGMCAALELESRAGGGYLDRAGWRVYDLAIERGAYIRPLGNVVYLAPALNIPDVDLDLLLDILDECLDRTLAENRAENGK
jgi:adenosylmethionine-8-amino-7-oxononanoate aminotransferase